MNFQHRPPTPEDFPACLELMYDRFRYDADARRRLAGLWGTVLDSEQGLAAVVEGVEPDGTRRVMGFGVNVFVHAAFAAELRAGALPYVTGHILERHRNGESPLLSRKGVRAGNAGAGLHMVALSVGHVWPSEAPPDVFHGVMGEMLASTRMAHRGYHIREAFSEVFGEVQRDFLLAGGLRFRNDYRDFFARSSPPPVPEHHPYLLGLTREEAVANPFSTLAFWFQYNRPRFGLKPAEQDLLKDALTGRTDGESALALSVSPWTIKKRWKSIYTRVEAVCPELLPGEADDASGGRPARGLERRRHLLNYLREHMEELRPH